MILQKYTKKGLLLFLIIMPVHTLLLNFLIFDTFLFTSFSLFLSSYALTFLVIGMLWQVHDRVAILLNERLPEQKDYLKQFFIKICFFILIKSLTLHFLFIGYEALYQHPLKQTNYILLLTVANALNVFVTILHEGLAGLEKWKEAIVETDKLKHTYAQSQLWHLKSQMNPHFLFNNLNTLSSLIEEDSAEAETYLDEMSKVYRYLLRHNEEHLVPLQEEIRFIKSYLHILSFRYGSALQFRLLTDGAMKDILIPPLTLQTVLENALTAYEVSKRLPLQFTIELIGDGHLHVHSNVQKKAVQNLGEGLKFENMVQKFELITKQQVVIEEDAHFRLIKLPLVKKAPKAALVAAN